ARRRAEPRPRPRRARAPGSDRHRRQRRGRGCDDLAAPPDGHAGQPARHGAAGPADGGEGRGRPVVRAVRGSAPGRGPGDDGDRPGVPGSRGDGRLRSPGQAGKVREGPAGILLNARPTPCERVTPVDRSDASRAANSAAALDRRQFLRGIAATGAVAGAGGLLTACSSASSSTPAPVSRAVRRGGSLKVGLTGGSGADTVDPHKGLTYLASSRLQSLYSPLLQPDANAQLEYMLAESIPPSNKTFTEWVIKLRPGVTFHSGKPLTADDVVFSFNRIVSNKFSGTNPLGPIDLKNTRALDSHTV